MQINIECIVVQPYICRPSSWFLIGLHNTIQFNAAQRSTAKPNICTYARKMLDAQPEMLTTCTNIPLIYRFKIFGRENCEEKRQEKEIVAVLHQCKHSQFEILMKTTTIKIILLLR